MQQQGPAQQTGFTDLYGRLQTEFADQLSEESAVYGRAGQNVREEIVRCVWFGGHYPADGLTTDDGRRIEVLSPGWWNVEGGPDFVRGEFALEGAGRVVGDVEVHTLASGWYAHGHDRQAEYNDVALHVVMWNDLGNGNGTGGKGAETAVRTRDGNIVPQLTLSRAVGQDVQELVELIGEEAEQLQEDWHGVEGRYCGRAYKSGELSPEWMGRLLDAAGDHRILTKASALGNLFANHSREQLLYERVAEALGYKNNRMPFMQMAGLLPARLLREIVPAGAPRDEKRDRLEAAFFVVSGLLQRKPPEEDDPETAAYRAKLQRTWEDFGEPPVQAKLSPDHWQFGGTRPVNYPTRRIAALAALYADQLHKGLFSHFLRSVGSAEAEPGRRFDVCLREDLLETFQQLDHPYWSHRYTFGGKKLQKPRALVGRERATTIVVNVLLPMLLAHARLEEETGLAERLHALWSGMPRRPQNTVTRRMSQVMFGSIEDAREVVDAARRQQGLHQIYRDCCRTGDGCDQCLVYLAHKAGRTLTDA